MTPMLSAAVMKKALGRLDELLPEMLELIIGGGGAMILAHDYPLATLDIDAIPKRMEIAKLDVLVKRIAIELKLPADWLNPYFSTFSFTLPEDYGDRLIEVFKGKNLIAHALGKEDMLVLKCFAHRAKDVGHARKLLRNGANTTFVEDHIHALIEKRIPCADLALEFFEELMEE